MKKKLLMCVAVVLTFALVATGCAGNAASGGKAERENTEAPTTAAPAEAPTEPPVMAPTEPPVTAPTEPLSESLPYLEPIPAEACVFRSPDAESAFSQTIGEDGTFTIVEEVRHPNGQIWGRLKSGVGWVNLSDPFCHGPNLPAVTASQTGQIVKNADHHQAGQTGGEYVIFLTFMPHEAVYDIRLEEENLSSYKTITTMEELLPGKPLVVGITLLEFNTFHLYYEKIDGTTGEVHIGQNYMDGPPLNFRYS